MTTAVRIKRKAGEIAADAIVLAPKIARTGNGDQAVGGVETNYTFHYAGSFKNPNTPEAEETIRRAKQAKRVKQDPKLRPVDLQSKLRDEYRSSTKKKRSQAVLQHRAIIEELCTEEIIDNDVNALRESTNSLFRLYDVLAEDAGTDQATKENVDPKEEEKTSKIACNNVAMVRETVKQPKADVDYVYDVYYSAAQVSLLREDEYSLFKIGSPDAFAPETEHDSDSDLGVEVHDDDSDSNAEDNWRNDYPDEDFEKRGSYYGDFYEEEGTDFMSGQLSGMTLNIGDDPEAEG
uniref:Probable RNA polymerase II nuclear localization protein SLC7A6OS n=1 Tax=Amblyomma aureolatum TaxID=187763 RepID=A0A1E1X5G7_9ACAR